MVILKFSFYLSQQLFGQLSLFLWVCWTYMGELWRPWSVMNNCDAGGVGWRDYWCALFLLVCILSSNWHRLSILFAIMASWHLIDTPMRFVLTIVAGKIIFPFFPIFVRMTASVGKFIGLNAALSQMLLSMVTDFLLNKFICILFTVYH